MKNSTLTQIDTTDTPQDAGRSFVAVLERAFHILDAFTVTDVWLGTTEIAARAALPKPTASRLAKSLALMHYLHYSPRRRKYRLGIGVLSLGYAARAESRINETIRPYLQDLADRFGVHASLVTRDQTDALHLDVCHSNNTLMTLRLEAGSRIPLAGTATGHAILAASSNAERKYLMDFLANRHHKHWPKIKAAVQDGIEQVDRYGYTISQRGWQTDINGVAAPLSIPGNPVYVLSCGAPALHLPRKKMDDIGICLVDASRQIIDRIAAQDTAPSSASG